MFQIIVTQLQNSCSQIERQIRQLSMEIGELENVIAALALLSSMGDQIYQLRCEVENMQQDEHILRQMLQILNKVLYNYISCENRIIDVCEQNVYFFEPRDMGIVNIQKIDDFISWEENVWKIR